MTNIRGKGRASVSNVEALDAYPHVRAWFLKEKPKREQEPELLREEIRTAGMDLLQAAPVRIHPDFLVKKGKASCVVVRAAGNGIRQCWAICAVAVRGWPLPCRKGIALSFRAHGKHTAVGLFFSGESVMELEARKAVLYSIFDAGVRAVAPDAALMRHVCLEGDSLLVDGKRWPLPRRGRLLVLGAGKGVAPMGAAVEELLGDRIHSGLLVVKYGHGLPLRQITQVEAAHPVPDAAGAAATQALLELAAGTTADDLVLCLLTGGGQCPDASPGARRHSGRHAAGDGAAAAQRRDHRGTQCRQEASVPFQRWPAGPDGCSGRSGERDRFRRGGGRSGCHRLRSHSARCFDVCGLHGHPCPLRTGTGHAACCPEPSSKGCLRQDAETPKPGDALFRHVQNALVATNRQALDAAAEQARQQGFRPVILTDKMVGEAREQAALLVEQARQMAAELPADAQPLCLLAGGETTVTLRGGGRGGRNQEMALAASLALQDCPHVCALFAGTDGTDGPTDAAGGCAWAGNLSVTGMEQARHALEENDSYPILHHCGALLRTGPTRTNVMDLAVLLVWPEKAQ